MEGKKGKVVSMQEAIRIIRDGDIIGTAGFVGIAFAEEVALSIEEAFLRTGHPRDLTLIYAAGIGDGAHRGLNHLAHEGLVTKVIGGHWGLSPKLVKLAMENKIIAYNLPQGVLSHMFRDIAAHRPRTITDVGLFTYVDPRFGGGRVNDVTREDLVELIEFDGQEYLAYKTMPINVAIVRGTTADTNGNITMEKEALTLDGLPLAMAAKNSGGFVIAQVERVTQHGTLPAKQVRIPGIFVDCVVLSQPEHHWQTFAEIYNPAFSSEITQPIQTMQPMLMDERKIMARRAAFELKPNSIINLGIGVPEGISSIAIEEKILDYLTLTAEPGIIGGLPAGGLNFGAGVNIEAIVDQPYQFDFYDGGGLDCAFLGLAQADRHGNLNVSKFGPKMAGCGGFINISQKAKSVIFVGSFTAGGLEVAVEDGTLRIVKEGRVRKFVDRVEQLTFSGEYALKKNLSVLYITERCVFSLTEKGLKLVEIAPGVDIERDIISHMDFEPIIEEQPRLMDKRIFNQGPMNLKADLLSVPLKDRFKYNPVKNIFFVNLEGYFVNRSEDIQEMEALATSILIPLRKKVFGIINYDNFTISPDLVDEYSDMVKRLSRYYSGVSRYTTSTFLRMKLGEALAERDVAPHIYENSEEARKALDV
ncbi:MAG TPA: acyl CoA:acetate/3-ketoacid CoA transferase [Deltaproteobacteria bacterium]|nr:acyl CoA:acetate/3-ketoacid CoA transferase [Deltaproteobacteria bacterium]HPJ92454.1 acyl CoA:acetate/3-ketoacid CoA transferase [Deltaproteobacteria bacterium]HPR50265.1 acyl CoA:acetate/3-ketoacid CoA transferase [Deltaproteobacteria bacterium]